MVITGTVKIELAKPTYRINPSELAGLAVSEEEVRSRVTSQLFQSAIQSKYPNGMDARDSRRWGPILDRLLDNEDLDLSPSDFDWLYRLFMDEDIRLLPGVAHWRLALESYLTDIKDTLRRAE